MKKRNGRVIETMVPESPVPMSNEELILQLAKEVEELTNENKELKNSLEEMRRKDGF